MFNRSRRESVDVKPVRPAQVMEEGVGVDRKRIGALMVEENLINAAQLSEALEVQERTGTKLVETLIAMGHLTVEAFIRFLSRQPGVASIDLANYQIPEELVLLVPREIAVKHEVFPIDRMGKLLTLGMACPLDTAAIKAIEERTGLRVKPLLCSAKDIRSAIKRYYPSEETDLSAFFEGLRSNSHQQRVREVTPLVESGIKLKQVSRLVREIESLPALPATVDRVRESMTDLSVSPNDVAKTIIQDPPVAAKVLGVANSAAYGFSHRVGTVELAVALLGLRETYSIVLSAAVLDLFEKSRRFDYKTYWEESMNCAAACRILAKACGQEHQPNVFTAGLLHDIGRIALLETVPELYGRVGPELSGEELILREEHVIGLTHAEAGYELATKWKLPADIALAIRFHHHPQFAEDHERTVAIVAIAETWTRANAREVDDREGQIEAVSALFGVLGIDTATAARAYDEIIGLDRIRFEWTAPEVAV